MYFPWTKGLTGLELVFTTATRPSATTTRLFKMRKKCRKPSAHVPEIESGKFALREVKSAQRPIRLRNSSSKATQTKNVVISGELASLCAAVRTVGVRGQSRAVLASEA